MNLEFTYRFINKDKINFSSSELVPLSIAQHDKCTRL